MNHLTFIHNVPVFALALIPARNSIDMIGHDLNQSLIIEVTVRHPRRELAVPYERMAAKVLVIPLCILDNGISLVKSEISLAWLRRLPFHGILGGDGSKVSRVVDDFPFRCIIADGEGCPDEFTSLGDEGIMETFRFTRPGVL